MTQHMYYIYLHTNFSCTIVNVINSFIMIFFYTSNRYATEESEEPSNQRGGTPVGITSPIRKNESQSRLPRETIRKFDGKSRDVCFVLNNIYVY